MVDIVSQLFLLVFLILLSAFFSGAEVALVSVHPIKVRTFVKEGRLGAKSLQRLKESQRRMIITILIGNNVTNIASASIATVMATDAFGSAGLGIATGVMTIIILTFGEITPKTFASTHSERIALAIARPIEILGILLYPLIILLETFSKIVNKLVKIKKAEPITEAEIRTMIEYGVEKKVIEPEESFIMARAFRLGDVTAEEVMTPFNKVFSLNANSTIQYSFNKIIESGFSRIPIYTDKKEKITGIIFVKDVLNAISKKQYSKKLSQLAIDPIFVSRKIHMDDLFKVFQNKQTHIAIVKDGKSIAGLVTLEDLLEELVGEITDEKDVTANTIIRIDKNMIVAHGNTPVERINRFFNTSLPTPRTTIKLNELIKDYVKIPKKNSQLHIGSLVMVLEDIRDGKILKVRLIKQPESDKKTEDETVVNLVKKVLKV